MPPPDSAAGRADRAEPWLLVVCSLEAWDEVQRRLQLLVGEILDLDPAVEVLFVEPALDVAYQLVRRDLHWGSPNRHPRERLTVVRPRKWLPRVFGSFTDRSLARQVRRAARRLQRRTGARSEPVLWINDSAYERLLRGTRWPSLYDITDDWLHSSLTPRSRERLETADRSLTEGCDVVVVCSPALAESHAAGHPVLLSNAVDVDHFRAPRPRPTDLPAAPVALYVGTLHPDRIDVGLCEALADALAPDATLVLVGPDRLGPAGDALRARPNAAVMGSRSYDDVPAYLQHADVVVVPHVVTPFTESLDPIKAYECLAVGRPTVATPVAGFRELGEPVVVAPAASFVSAVQAQLAAATPARPQPVPTWHERATTMHGLLDELRQSGRGARSNGQGGPGGPNGPIGSGDVDRTR